jgi:pilus assembly protein CpaB
MKRRLLISALALVLAAFGTGVVFAYVKSADARAIAGLKAVSVLVASKQIPSGTSAAAAQDRGLLVSQKLPASSVPASAVSVITPGLSSLVLGTGLQSGQLLLRPMLVTAAHVTGGLALPPGMIAVTVNLCLPEAVAGDLRPGAEVAVFDTIVTGGGGQVSAGPACTGPHQQPGGNPRTRLVLARVQVVSTGAAASSGSTTTAGFGGSSSSGGQTSMMVTLAVSQAQAEHLIQITETGLPYLALLNSSSRTSADAGRLLAQSLVPPSPSPSPTPKTPRPIVRIVIPTPAAPTPTPTKSPGK